MSRWSETYKARVAQHDIVDNIDEKPPAAAPSSLIVNIVHNVTVAESEDQAASDAAYEATERAAIVAESLHGNAAVAVLHILPPSWSDPQMTPTAGARCHCCHLGAWWTETARPAGWRCMTCHPPAHLETASYRMVAT
jgi:hypothetical protein